MEFAQRQEIECPLRSAARECPTEPALIAPDRTFSFRELDVVVTATAGRLAEKGFPNRRVAFLLEPGWRYVTLVLAALRAGVTACPLSTRLPNSALGKLLARIGAAALVSDRSEPEDSIHPRELLSGAIRSMDDAVLNLEQPATIVFTSGSTGGARAALHTFGNHYFSAQGSNQNISVAPGDRWALALPLYHVGGLAILFRCLLGRAAVYVPEPATSVHAAVANVTHVSMVATQLRRLLESGADPDLKALLLGGSAIPDRLIDDAHRLGLPIHTSYGLTEMASQVATTPPGASLDVLKTAGHVLPHREVQISPDGEILVRGRTRFEGYVEGDETSRPFDDEGWFATGDLGTIEDGLLRVSGRKDHMFISGGENIAPEEIEAALTTLPDVVQAVVVPVADDEFGHRPVAFVRIRSGELDPDALRVRLEKLVPRFMLPVAFYSWPEGEEEGAMKVNRERMRQKAEARRHA